MSGLPVYTQSPINTATAAGISPRTAAPAPPQRIQSKLNTYTVMTTAIPSSTSTYPAARPGAAAMQAPTSAAQRYAPPQPTRTIKIEDDGPPPPEPGSVTAPPFSLRSNLPPPPKAGEKLNSAHMIMPQAYSSQIRVPLPSVTNGAQPPSTSISTTTMASSPYPVTLPSDRHEAPRRSLEHPPGYLQNPHASNISAEQRRAQDAQIPAPQGNYEHEKPGTTAAFGVDPEGVWNVAKAWATTAGKKLSEVESEVWRKVNGEN